jgi:hypothetical protein
MTMASPFGVIFNHEEIDRGPATICRHTPANIKDNAVSDTPEKQTSQTPSPDVIFPARLSDRMIAEANKMFREAFGTPRAKKRKPSHEQQRRTRAKQRNNSASP